MTAKPRDVISAGIGITTLHVGTNMLHVQTKLKNNINFKKFLIGGEPFRYQDGCVFVRTLSQIQFLTLQE